tara:strand:+ start:822 stop:1160 length:339 start_codon:yes stop_codon:yes gene_type:complete
MIKKERENMSNNSSFTEQDLQRQLGIVKGHIKHSVNNISKITNTNINQDLVKELETFIIKTTQKMEIENEISLRMLKGSFKKLSFRNKMGVYLIKPKRWLKKIFRGDNEKNN